MDSRNDLATSTPEEVSSFIITEPMLRSLRRTKPWARMVSVVGFIFVGLIVTAGAVNIFTLVNSAALLSLIPLVLLIGATVLIALLYLLPCLYLFKFASSLTGLLEGGGAHDMEKALAHQEFFWKFVGILTLILCGMVLSGSITAFLISR